MKRSDQPTEYILIKAYSTSEVDYCNFAIIRITEQWIADMLKRMDLLEPFKDDNSFYSHHYLDSPEGYYTNIYNKEEDADITDLILTEDGEWTFVTLAENELNTFPVPENRLDTHQLVLTKGGLARFTAYCKHAGEEFYTADFSPKELINVPVIKIVDINYGQLSKDFINFIWSQQAAWRDQVLGTDLYDLQDILLNQPENSPYPDDILAQLSEIGNLLREQDCNYFRVVYS